MALKRMSITVSEDMYSWISEEAESRGLTKNAVVIFALETYYERTKIMPNLATIQEMMKQAEDLKK